MNIRARTFTFTSRGAALVAFFVATIAAVILLTANPTSAQSCNYAGGSTDCNGWTFDYYLAGDSVSPTGLTLTDIEYNGQSVMAQANFAGLPVQYENNACGPYVDLFSTLTNSTPTGVQASTFSRGGQNWLEMGANYQIGQYVLYTAFYFGDNGEMKMRMFARGLQCSVTHEHYPIYVIDVDLEGNDPSQANHGQGDEVFYNPNGTWIEQTAETDNQVTQVGHDWIVRDPDSGMTVLLQHDIGAFDPPSGDAFAAQGGANNIIYTRDAGPLREYAWPGAPTNGGQNFLGSAGYNGGQWAYNEGEALSDPVLVVRGLLDHEYRSDLPDDWHTAGISLSIIDDPLDSSPPPPPPPPPPPEPGSGPYADHAVPGVIEAEDYDYGRQQVGYLELDNNQPSNRGNEYRPADDVDIYDTVRDAGGHTVGRTVNGEWLQYTVDVPSAGLYEFDLKMATGAADAGRIEVSVDGAVVGSAEPSARNDWWGFRSESAGQTQMSAGEHVIRLTWRSGAQINLDSFEIIEIDEPVEPPSGPYADHQAPGVIQAEDYDYGGQGVAFNDLDDNLPAGRGDAYRPNDDVDIYPTVREPGGYTVGRTFSGEWLEYTVDFAEAGSYRFDLRMATGTTGAGRIAVTVDGNTVGEAAPVADNDWWAYQEVSAGSRAVSAGTHTVRLTWVGGGNINLDKLTISPASTTPAPTFADVGSVYVSPAGSVNVGNIAARDEDIVGYNANADAWQMVFDGSDVGFGTTGVDLAAFDIGPDNTIWLSPSVTMRVPGINRDITANDIVRFTPSSLGDVTAGNYELIFDGSDVGLNTAGESITGLTRGADGDIYISTRASGRVGGIDIRDVDVLRFTPTQLGALTQGTWSLHLQGADLGLSFNGSEDIWGISSFDGGLFLTTRSDYAVPGVSGSQTDIVSCQPTRTGESSACGFAFLWDATSAGFPNAPIDGIDVVLGQVLD